jgi:ABC-2 type transport system ATP-binding protein
MDGTTALSIFGAVRGRDLGPSGRKLAGRFDLDLDVKVREMSRGMRQKLGIILALAHSPRLLILDEPTSALDPLMQETLRETLREGAGGGQTIFFSSHSLPEVEELCDQVAIVRNGRVVADESLRTLRERAGHEVTIRWRNLASESALEPPSFLKLARRQGGVWQGRLEGPVQPLIDFLAGKGIEDVTIGRPDLESLFRQFYEHEQEAD